MVAVLDGEQKQIQLLDQNGNCFKRVQSDGQYYIKNGDNAPNMGCDAFATLTVKMQLVVKVSC